eukprot:10167-Heterococcus_DN1.PRE.4
MLLVFCTILHRYHHNYTYVDGSEDVPNVAEGDFALALLLPSAHMNEKAALLPFDQMGILLSE